MCGYCFTETFPLNEHEHLGVCVHNPHNLTTAQQVKLYADAVTQPCPCCGSLYCMRGDPPEASSWYVPSHVVFDRVVLLGRRRNIDAVWQVMLHSCDSQDLSWLCDKLALSEACGSLGCGGVRTQF